MDIVYKWITVIWFDIPWGSNYLKYLSEETECITIQKPKLSIIKDIIVVLNEFFGYKKNFSSLDLPESVTRLTGDSI